jgi:hypothetical protein
MIFWRLKRRFRVGIGIECGTCYADRAQVKTCGICGLDKKDVDSADSGCLFIPMALVSGWWVGSLLQSLMAFANILK